MALISKILNARLRHVDYCVGSRESCSYFSSEGYYLSFRMKEQEYHT